MHGEIAIRAAELSELAYVSQDELAEMFRSGFRYIKFGPIKGFVLKEGDVVYVVFKGTDPKNLASWIVDLNASKTKTKWIPGKVHAGFWEALESVIYSTTESVGDLISGSEKGDTIVFCGHSQGAAIAALYAVRVFYISARNMELHLFGCPRFCNTKFARRFDLAFKSNTYRWVNNNDVVTRIPLGLTGWLHKLLPPLRYFPMGYRHVGQLCYFDVCGKLQKDVTRFQLFKDRLAGRILHFGKWLTDGIEDHYIDRYVELVKGAFRK